MLACCSIRRAMRSPWRRALGESVHGSCCSKSLGQTSFQGRQSGWQCKVQWWDACLPGAILLREAASHCEACWDTLQSAEL